MRMLMCIGDQPLRLYQIGRQDKGRELQSSDTEGRTSLMLMEWRKPNLLRFNHELLSVRPLWGRS